MSRKKKTRRADPVMTVTSSELVEISGLRTLADLVRSDERITLRREVHTPVLVQSARTGLQREGRILDLSPRGARVVVDMPVEHGEELLLSFRPPRWVRREHLLARAEVARVDPGVASERDLGVRFVELPRTVAIELDACLRGTPPPLPRPGAKTAQWVSDDEVVSDTL